MGRFTKTGILVEEFHLSSQDFFEYNKDGNKLTIIRRAGIEKIAKQLGVTFYGLQVEAFQLRNEPIFIAVVNAKKRMDENDSENCIKVWSDPVNTSASAAPSNCMHERYPEIAEARVKERAVLMLADLHELHVHAEGASSEFERESLRLLAPKSEKVRQGKPMSDAPGISKDIPAPKPKKTALEETEYIAKALQEKLQSKRNNADLLK